ncbi:hypothetical protein ECC31_05610 [Helicobacter pylori]|nr:hypothetical protein ECC31_05610 [Helicobacter pylori]
MRHARNPLNIKCWSVSFFLFVKGVYQSVNSVFNVYKIIAFITMQFQPLILAPLTSLPHSAPTPRSNSCLSF